MRHPLKPAPRKFAWPLIFNSGMLLSLLLALGCNPGNTGKFIQRTCYLADATGLKLQPDHPIRYQGREIGKVQKLELAENPSSQRRELKFTITLDQTQFNPIPKPVIYCTPDPRSGETLIEVLPAAQMPTDVSNIVVMEMP